MAVYYAKTVCEELPVDCRDCRYHCYGSGVTCMFSTESVEGFDNCEGRHLKCPLVEVKDGICLKLHKKPRYCRTCSILEYSYDSSDEVLYHCPLREVDGSKEELYRHCPIEGRRKRRCISGRLR